MLIKVLEPGLTEMALRFRYRVRGIVLFVLSITNEMEIPWKHRERLQPTPSYLKLLYITGSDPFEFKPHYQCVVNSFPRITNPLFPLKNDR